MIISFEVKAEVVCEQPTGTNGYYLESPVIVIKHDGENIMRYRLQDSNGKVISGRLDAMMKTVTIQKDVLKDGKNTLDLWKENEEGEVIEGSMFSWVYHVDQTPPKNPLQFIEGESLEIIAEDEYAGIESIFYSINGGEFYEVKDAHVYVSLSEEFQGKICAYATDRAGNQGEYCYFEKKIVKEDKNEIAIEKTEKKDIEPPCIEVIGIEDFIISKEAVSFQCYVNDNHSIEIFSGKIIHKNENGEEIEYDITDWKKTEKGYETQTELNETGIYQIYIEAEDLEGNQQALHYQVIIDMTAPVVHGLEKWRGANLHQFQWNYKDNIVIQDITSTTYEVRMDGILYSPGKKVEDVGKHILEVRARDLAGNEAREQVIIQIQEVKETDIVSKEEEVVFPKHEKIEEKRNYTSVFAGMIIGIACLLIGYVMIKLKQKTP